MMPVFKCDYCKFMGTEEEVRKHEPTCIDNYNKRSCYTCKHRGKLKMVNNLVKYECDNGKDIPAGNVYEFCDSYERVTRITSDNLFGGVFGGFGYF